MSVNISIRTIGLDRNLRVPLEVGRLSPPDIVSFVEVVSSLIS
jgi:hypothetical protein